MVGIVVSKVNNDAQLEIRERSLPSGPSALKLRTVAQCTIEALEFMAN